jgi:hypothetical protein
MPGKVHSDGVHACTEIKVTIHPRFSGTVLEIRHMSRTDFVPYLLNTFMQFEKQGPGIAMGYGVADQLRLIDYNGAEPRNT